MYSVSGGFFSVASCFMAGRGGRGRDFYILLFIEGKNRVDLALVFTVIKLPKVYLAKTGVKN